MAEAAAVATVVQLIQFSGIVLSGCYQYISKAKAAEREITNVINDVSGLEGILKRLHELIENNVSDRQVLLSSLGRPGGTFQACGEALKDLQKRLASLTNASGTRRKLLWPLEEGKIFDIRRRLGEHKQAFILALVGDLAISSKGDALQGRETVERLKSMQSSEERSKILNWLGGSDPSTNYNAARKTHEENTGDWLLQSEQLRSWMDANGQIMWLTGIPGAGKTILTSTVIDHLFSRRGSQNVPRVAYYFFDFSDAGKQTLIGFLRSIAKQLCTQVDPLHLPEPLKALYVTCKGENPSASQLTHLLSTLNNGSSADFIVVDALDECLEQGSNREREAFFDMLSQLKGATVGTYNIFISSRPEPDIRSAMSLLANSMLDVQGPGIYGDIHSHIVAYLSNDTRMRKWPPGVKDEVIKDLSEKANGMFRWAVCQLEVLRKCLKPTPTTIKKKLADLPRTLDATYEKIFHNMDSEYEREIRTILMLLAFSARPMTIQEIAEATAVNLETQCFDPNDRFPDPFAILEVCSSLVSLAKLDSQSKSTVGAKDPDWVPGTQILHFAHFSVKEFILSERAQVMISPSLRIDRIASQERITELCLLYMLDLNGGERAVRINHAAFPMFRYAALHWRKHMAAVSSRNAGTIQRLLVRLLNSDGSDNHNESDWLLMVLNTHEPAWYGRLYSAGKPLVFSGDLDVGQWLEKQDTNGVSLGPLRNNILLLH